MSETRAPSQLPLARPVIGEREEQLVLEVLRSGTLALGPMLTRFERKFGEWLGAAHCSAVSSGTAGLHLAVRACEIAAGDEVITSPLSFIASANVIVYEGATPVFADIDPVTLNIDPAKAAAAVTEKTTGLLPVHIFGYPAAIEEFEALAAERDLWIVEDACEALGGVHADRRRVGARGHFSVFGFYPNKQLTTGEGGMVVCPDASAKRLIDSERNQGRAPNMGWLDHERLGFNYRLSDVAAAIGVAQLERLDEMLAARALAASRYDERIAALPGVTTPCADRDGEQRGWFVYVVQLPAGTDRDAVIAALAAEGVAGKPYMPVIHLQPYYRERFGYATGDFPIAEDVAERSLALPFFPQITEAEIDRTVATLGRALA
ncbi:MAG: DegT/DnrJ/EryC1/StrS family aminotransferase [Thermoleophilia bacterium]|nr:DegT/DnrJ/EryC1/StrS family aminotransferase [Thermoleophilia bacterium]